MNWHPKLGITYRRHIASRERVEQLVLQRRSDQLHLGPMVEVAPKGDRANSARIRIFKAITDAEKVSGDAARSTRGNARHPTRSESPSRRCDIDRMP